MPPLILVRRLRLAFLAVLLVFLIFQGDRAQIVGFGIIGLVIAQMVMFPRSWLTRLLASQRGPSLNADELTRGECFQNAGSFLLLAPGAFASLALVSWAAASLPSVGSSATTLMLLVMYGLFTLMGLFAAVYLSLRGMFRPRDISRSGKRE